MVVVLSFILEVRLHDRGACSLKLAFWMCSVMFCRMGGPARDFNKFD